MTVHSLRTVLDPTHTGVYCIEEKLNIAATVLFKLLLKHSIEQLTGQELNLQRIASVELACLSCLGCYHYYSRH